MKRQILLLAFIAVSTFSFAQTEPSFGIRGCLSSAKIQGEAVNNLQNILDFADGMINTTNHNGFFAGTYATIPLGTNVSIEPAVYYTQKGYEMQGDFNFKGA